MVRYIHYGAVHIIPVHRILVMGKSMHCFLRRNAEKKQRGKPQRENAMEYPAGQDIG